MFAQPAPLTTIPDSWPWDDFGFIAAAIAGFLLTAVPGWTGRSSYGVRRHCTVAIAVVRPPATTTSEPSP